MKAYILFQTDLYKTKSTRICFGVFSSESKAIENAKQMNLYSHSSEVDIVEVIIDRLEES